MPRRPRTLLLTAAAALLALTLPTAAHANTAAQALTQPYTLQLRPGNIWDKPFPIGAALDSASATYGPAFARSVGITQDTNGAWKVTGPSGLRWRSAYNIYTVDTATTWKKACARNPSVAPWIPPVHERTVTQGVPVPDGPLAYDGGADHSMAIYQPASQYYAEFYVGLNPAPAGTVDSKGRRCDYTYLGGAVTSQLGGGGPNASFGTFRQTGVFPTAPAANELVIEGRQATGAMPVITGLITASEWDAVANGTAQDFGHVVSFVVPAAKCGVRHWPAQRNDCNGGGKIGVLPEGAWFHLPADTNCARWDGQISTNVQPRLGYLRRLKGMCVNAIRYGFRVVDQTGNGAAFKTESKPRQSDGGSAGGGQHWPNEYIDPWAPDLARIEVIADGGQAHFAMRQPGCFC